jgi:hypothetical protein
MWNIFEQPWTGLAVALIALNVMAVVRWFVPLERRWLFIPPAVIAVLALALCYLIETDREKAQRVFSMAVKAVREQNPGAMEKLIAPDYSDPAHPTKRDFVNSWQIWLGEVKLENVGTSNVVYEMGEGKATVTFNWLLRFGKKPGTSDYLSGSILYGRAKVQIGRSTGAKWLIQSSELLEIMNRPTSWRRVNF